MSNTEPLNWIRSTDSHVSAPVKGSDWARTALCVAIGVLVITSWRDFVARIAGAVLVVLVT